MIKEIFEKISQLKVLIIGDVMLDSYVWGKVERISPEAPVPVVNVQKREMRLGGAANVALNIRALGAEPILCSVLGRDLEGKEFLSICKKENLTTTGIVASKNRLTTVKHRIIAGSQQICRVDSEQDNLLDEEEKKALLAKIEELLPSCDVLIFEDYDKGVLDKELIQKSIELAQKQGIKTITDPKKRNFLHYAGVDLFKPNLKELKEGLYLNTSFNDWKKISQEALEKLQVQGILLTLSEKGVCIKHQNKFHHISAHIRQIADVSGAGDTVVSVAALCLALNLSPLQIAQWSNLAGGIVCETVGVVPISKERLMEEIKKEFYSYSD